MTIDFSDPSFANGLVTEDQRFVDRLLRDYSPRLSLRRVPTTDPAFDPAKPYGVYEEGVRSDREVLSPWVFFVPETGMDARVLARIYENDFAKHDADKLAARRRAFAEAQQTAQRKQREEAQQAKNEEALDLLRIMQSKTTVRHDFGDGDGRVIIGDEIRSGRTYIDLGSRK